MLSPLSPLLYFRRNLGRTLPVAGIVILAVTLLSSVVTVIHSIDLTVFTLYGYNRYVTGITPRNALNVAQSEVDKIKKQPDLGVLYPVHSYQIMIKTIFGKMVFPLFGMEMDARTKIMARCHIELAHGRLPADGKPEAAVSEAVAQNLGLKIGDVIAQPELEDAYAPIPIRLVGTLKGPVWLGVTSKSLVDTYSPFTWSGYLAVGRTNDLAQQRRLDDEIAGVVDKAHARVWRYAGLIREIKSALSNLYLILNVIIVLVSVMIAATVGLLINIYFVQRLPEFAMLAAMGYPRSMLLRRTLSETLLLCLAGWLVGGLVTGVLLTGVRDWLLRPRGLLLNPFDLSAYGYTLPLPITILLFAFATISVRLASLDPVSIIERRA